MGMWSGRIGICNSGLERDCGMLQTRTTRQLVGVPSVSRFARLRYKGPLFLRHMSHYLDVLKGDDLGGYIGEYYRSYQGCSPVEQKNE